MAHIHSTRLNVAGTPYQDSAMQLLIAELTDKGLEMMDGTENAATSALLE